jgi:hypothetical protein
MPGQRSATSWGLLALVTALVALGAWFYTRLLWRSFPEFVLRMDHCNLLFCDFVRHYWRTGRNLLQTHEPGPGFLYSPFFALLMVPLGALAKATAVVVWGVIQGLALLLLFAVPLARESSRRWWIYSIYVVAFAVSVPLYHNFKWGQISVPLTALTLLALEFERRDRSIAAACLLAFATALKGYVGLFAWILLARGRRWALLVFATGVIVWAVIVPSLAIGPGDTFHFYAEVNTRLSRSQLGFATDANSQNLASVITRWGTPPDEMLPAPAPALRVVGLALAGASLALAWRGLRGASPRFGSAVALSWLSIPLVLQTSWPHYFVYLPAVGLIALLRLADVAVPRAGWWTALTWVVACLLLTMLPMLQWSESWLHYAHRGWLLLADLGLLTWFWAEAFLPRREAHA